MSSANIELNEAIEQNLASYIDANKESSPSDYKVKRELDIARHSLEESLSLHKLISDIVKSSIAQLSANDSTDNLFKLISLANSLEDRHNKLQNSAKRVASIAKQGAEIENLLATKLDAAQVYSVIVQLPQLLLALVESTVATYLHENKLHFANGSRTIDGKATVRELSHVIANKFNEEVERSVSVLTYGEFGPSSANADSGLAVVEQQVVDMLNSVPTATVVPPESAEARVIREEQT